MRSGVTHAKWTLARRGAGLTTIVLSLASCCPVAPKGPCVAWAHEGERFDIELLSLLTFTWELEQPSPQPFSGYPMDLQTCGTGLDLDGGSVLQLRVGSERGPTERQCNDGCYEHDATATVDGVESLEPSSFSHLGQAYLSARSEVRIGNCRAYYAVGVMPVSVDFKTTHPELVESDYVLFRELVPIEDISACEVPGSTLGMSPSGRCYDVWSIRVVNEQGEQVSEDI